MLKRFGVLFLLLALVGCGFHLRGANPTHHISLKRIAIQPNDPYAANQRELRAVLRQSGVKMVEGDSDAYTLRLLDEQLKREVLLIGTDAQTKQSQLILVLTFELVPPHADPLPRESIRVYRTLNVDQNRLLGQNQEERTLINEMRTDAAHQLLYRLSVIHENNP